MFQTDKSLIKKSFGSGRRVATKTESDSAKNPTELTELTRLPVKDSVSSGCQLLTCQLFTVASQLPESKILPSGDMAKALTKSEWPLRDATSLKVSRSQIVIFPASTGATPSSSENSNEFLSGRLSLPRGMA
jgi:hypothetical protein